MVNKIKASLSDIKLVFVQSWLHIRISIAYPYHIFTYKHALFSIGFTNP